MDAVRIDECEVKSKVPEGVLRQLVAKREVVVDQPAIGPIEREDEGIFSLSMEMPKQRRLLLANVSNPSAQVEVVNGEGITQISAYSSGGETVWSTYTERTVSLLAANG